MEMLVLTLLLKRSLKYIGKATFRQYEGKSSVFAPGPASLVLQLTAGVWDIKRTCMDNISRYHECLQFTRSQKNPSSPGKLIFLLVKCKSSPCRGMRFLLSMQIYLGNTGSRGPYWIAGLLGLGSPFAGSKCLSYRLPLDINIQKTFGPCVSTSESSNLTWQCCCTTKTSWNKFPTDTQKMCSSCNPPRLLSIHALKPHIPWF